MKSPPIIVSGSPLTACQRIVSEVEAAEASALFEGALEP